MKDIMGSFADSFLRVITSITILFRKSLTLKPGAIRYQEKYWHIIHQMKSLKENWIISIKQLKCSIYYCNLRKEFAKANIANSYWEDLNNSSFMKHANAYVAQLIALYQLALVEYVKANKDTLDEI